MEALDWRHRVLALVVAVQLLMIPAYRSTDFEVHRNWLAITYSLPISKWYYDATSEWTLDYPPLFAWFEWAMAQVAKRVDPAMLAVSNLEYDSDATVLFQRLSVTVTGLLLAGAMLYATRGSRDCSSGGGLLLFFLVVANAGLLIVDNIHFQYNGVLLGVLMWSVLLAQEGRDLAAGVLFAVLLNMKHLFSYAAPVYFVYLLRHYCMGVDGSGNGGGGGAAAFVGRLALLGGAVVAVFGASLGPFVAMGQLQQLLRRMFPFGRGLTHAYWAANFWALYSCADKVLAAVLSRLGLIPPPAAANMAGGIVGVSSFAVLAQVSPGVTMTLVLAAMVPCLAALWRRPSPAALAGAVAYANLCGFMFGWHVHEKAALMATVPLALPAVRDARAGVLFLVLATASHVAMFPLLFEPRELPIRWLLVLLYTLLAWHGLARVHGGWGGAGARAAPASSSGGGASRAGEPGKRVMRSQAKRSGDGPSDSGSGGGCGQGVGEAGAWQPPGLLRLYLWGLIPIELYCSLGHEALLGQRLPFLPLLITSVYCAAGVGWAWLDMAAGYVQQALGREQGAGARWKRKAS